MVERRRQWQCMLARSPQRKVVNGDAAGSTWSLNWMMNCVSHCRVGWGQSIPGAYSILF
uniref:Uncharacterized protein n=1 Tax=Arundo donax TaxID=35708 RepID=A0A0A9AS53_ARUDO